MPIDGDYETAARGTYAAVLPTAGHAFPPGEADIRAAVEVIRKGLEAAYLDGRTAAVLTPPYPAGDPFPGREAALLTPGSGQ